MRAALFPWHSWPRRTRIAWRKNFIQTLLERQLAPWYANLTKRQIKSPKIYLRDTGLLHQLLGIRTEQELLLHPKIGASWEGYVVEEVIKTVAPDGVYSWGTHAGAHALAPEVLP